MKITNVASFVDSMLQKCSNDARESLVIEKLSLALGGLNGTPESYLPRFPRTDPHNTRALKLGLPIRVMSITSESMISTDPGRCICLFSRGR